MIRLVVVEPENSHARRPMLAASDVSKSGMRRTVPVTTVRGGLAYPRADYFETDNELVVRLDVPGAAKGDLMVDYDSPQLRVVWQKKPQNEGGLRLLSNEVLTGTFTRTFALPPSIEIERISAEVRDGVMTIRAAKRSKLNSQRIEVS